VPPGAIGDAAAVVGRGLIEGVVENELILEGKMAPKDAGAGLPPAIPPGMRALSVRVNEVIGVAGYVLPGTRVDVVVTISPGSEVTSKIVLTNVLVLAAGTKIERDLENNQPISVTVVTLLVNPEEAERLTLATTEGRIQLALRNPLDQAAPPTPGIRPTGLIAGGARPAAPRRAAPRVVQASGVPAPPPAPAPPPPPTTIEIIRGDKRVRETVPRTIVYADVTQAPAPAPADPPRETAAPPEAPAERAPESPAPAAVVSQSAAPQE
jgi:pilus assembly protein CpaB